MPNADSKRRDEAPRTESGRVWGVLHATARDWWADDVFELSAALAFYTIFSMAPIVSIALWIAGGAFGSGAAERGLLQQVEALIGPNAAVAIQAVIEGGARSEGGVLSNALALGTLLLGSTAVFGQLQSALNRIWDVAPDPDGGALRHFAKKRLLSFGLVLAVGFLLLVSLILSTALTALHGVLSAVSPWVAWHGFDLALSFVVTVMLFTAVYKMLPDARVAWRDAVVGGIVTALLFSVGKLAISFYLGHAALGSAYGAAGSFAVLLVWVYYAALVCFLGAEFTQAYARRYGSRARPEPHAVRQGEKPDGLIED